VSENTAAEGRRDTIRSLNAAYQALVRLEGVSTVVDAALNAVQVAILEYCPDAEEYDRVVRGHRDYERYTYPAEQNPHDQALVVTRQTGEVIKSYERDADETDEDWAAFVDLLRREEEAANPALTVRTQQNAENVWAPWEPDLEWLIADALVSDGFDGGIQIAATSICRYLADKGYSLVKTGEVPPWMEFIPDPDGTRHLWHGRSTLWFKEHVRVPLGEEQTR
jgi:hypothetical protein